MRPNKKISSLKNPQVKKIGLLRDKKTRHVSGTILVEGLREVLRAWEAKLPFQELYVCRELIGTKDNEVVQNIIRNLPIKLTETSKKVFEKIAFGDRREGIIAVCQKPQLTLNDLKLSDRPFLVVVEKIEKPGNLGAILRTCDAAGVDGLILCESKVDLYNPNVVRASVGCVFCVKVMETSNTEALAFLRKNQAVICAATPQAKTPYTQTTMKGPLAIAIGSEDEGLSPFWLQNADMQVKIPMLGKADSLNASASSAILIYEALRQRSS